MSNPRRNFLKNFSLSSIGVLLPSLTMSAKPKETEECLVTTPDEKGPFFKPGAPVKSLIAEPTEFGDRLSIQGKIYGQDCSTPLNDAIIDVWQANARGVYDTSENYTLRGKVRTVNEGSYSFETVYPGSYDRRAAHIHLMVSAPGFRTLITQLYFQGDPLIPRDPFANRPGTGPRIIPLRNDNSHFYGDFNIYLDANTTAISSPIEQGYLAQAGPNPFSEVTSIIYSNYEDAEVGISIYNIHGRIVKELVHQEMAKGKYTLTWDGRDDSGASLPTGVYICKMELNHQPLKEIRLIRK